MGIDLWLLIGLMVARILMGGLNILMGGLIGGIDQLFIGNPAYKSFTIFYYNVKQRELDKPKII